MTDEQAHLAAILAYPDDDSPRLIFADWLEEHGHEERAEFIRVQVELAKPIVCEWETIDRASCREFKAKLPLCPSIVHCPACRQRAKLACREQELLGNRLSPSSTYARWLGPLLWNLSVASSQEPFVFRRGFVEEITLGLAAWLDHGTALVQATPLRTVRLTGDIREWPIRLRQLAQDDEPGDNPICRLHTLDLTRIFGLDRHRLLVSLREAYRPWRGLRELILPNWSDLKERYRPHEIEQWKQIVPSLEVVRFGAAQREEANAR